MELLDVLQQLNDIFTAHNFTIYAVGGTVRDFLLNMPVDDLDFVTDATPKQMKEFLSDGDYSNAFFGAVKIDLQGHKIDITTLRKEGNYADLRHPKEIIFVKKIEEDYLRRDFTINAMYMDAKGRIFDFCNGNDDLKAKVIRTIGDAQKRIAEDPIRMIRAARFALRYGFFLDDELKKAIKANQALLTLIKTPKLQEEYRKLDDKLPIDEGKKRIERYLARLN